MAALQEKLNSRMVEQDDNGITITFVYFGDKGDFSAGYNGWTFILPTAVSTPATGWVGSPMSALAAATGMLFSATYGYDAPVIAYVSTTPRWTKAKGFVKVVCRGVSVWQG